jgi:3',5'-cyclic AMP phosphodiesterase CpdA
MPEPLTISVAYDEVRLSGRLERIGEGSSSIWDRLQARAVAEAPESTVTERSIELPWPDVLRIVREYGTREMQQTLNFRFAPVGDAGRRVQQFSQEVRRARAARSRLTLAISEDEILQRLSQQGFKRELKAFQLRDLARLLSLPHGANFSVPGAGKTTVAFALHLLTRQRDHHFFVIGPKASFPAWQAVIDECLELEANAEAREPFTLLQGDDNAIQRALSSGATRFIISYDLMIRQRSLLSSYFSRQSVHLLLDEAHRMKAGTSSQRGSFLLTVANLPVRRDILTGTPMPNGTEDLASQLAFLWPGHGLDLQIQRGVSPRAVLGSLYVRTTKSELGLRPPTRHFTQIAMAPAQMALYSIVRDETLRQLVIAVGSGSSGPDYLGARRSVMRLLQLSANPILALNAITGDRVGIDSGLVDAVVDEGPSPKMLAVAEHARQLASSGQKSVIWTIFTDTIRELERMLADLNPVSLYGAVPTGDPDELTTREGRLRRFHRDPACQVIIANPAAAGEGISLHEVCHHALYLDRSYVSTHYLQSIDRIHRLGLPPDVETHIHIYQTKAPVGLGSIDMSVSRRLATKLRNLQLLLEDPDLQQLALDEENADDPVDYDIQMQDLVDLVEELEGRGGGVAEEEA